MGAFLDIQDHRTAGQLAYIYLLWTTAPTYIAGTRHLRIFPFVFFFRSAEKGFHLIPRFLQGVLFSDTVAAQLLYLY